MSIEDLAQQYQPGDEARTAVSMSNTLLLVGISGAGKDTIQSLLLERDEYHRIVTHTTRAPRRNDGILEQDGREYHFVSKDEMATLLRNKQMIEVNQYGDNFYGTSVDEFIDANHSKKIALANIDVNGIAAVRSLGGESVRALFVLPPSYEEWVNRLKNRYPDATSFDEVFSSRRGIAIDELAFALSVPYYHFIINDDLERAVRVIDEIAHKGDEFNRHDDEARLVARDLLEEIANAE